MPAATPPPLDEITENFAFLDTWEDRFSYLIDLGKKLPDLPPQYLDEPHKVHGCQSNVWLHLGLTPPTPASDGVSTNGDTPLKAGPERSEGPDQPTLDLLAKSDAHIVNGLIAILRSLYHGQTLDHALTADAESLFQQLGLDEHLSPTRRNGLHAMIQRIRQLAQAKRETTDEHG